MLTGRDILRHGAALCSFRRKLLFEYRLDRPEPAVSKEPAQFRFGGAPDLLALTAPEFGYNPQARKFGLERLAAGDRFVVGEAAGRVVFYAWVMFGQLDLSCGHYVPLDAGEAYTYKLYTVPGCRGLGICLSYYRFLKRELRALGCRAVLAWVEAGNRVSLRAHARAGFRRIGCIWHIRLLHRSYFIQPALNAAPAQVPAANFERSREYGTAPSRSRLRPQCAEATEPRP